MSKSEYGGSLYDWKIPLTATNSNYEYQPHSLNVTLEK